MNNHHTRDDFVLFCKSYKNDVLRVKRLLQSVNKFNKDSIKFYLSTPESDHQFFIDAIGEEGYYWVSDEHIAQVIPCKDVNWLKNNPGYITQQIIKSEFWRLGYCNNYLCLDSDSQFINFFTVSDFMDSSGHPFTILHDCSELLDAADQHGFYKVRRNFLQESNVMKSEFSRLGPDYDFGPSPLIWSWKVWQWLADEHLRSKGEMLTDAIVRIPSEIRWYGEALLSSRLIPIISKNQLFKCYHFDWQHSIDKKNKIQISDLKEHYLGVVYQSNWESDYDLPMFKKSIFSRFLKFIKKAFKFSF